MVARSAYDAGVDDDPLNKLARLSEVELNAAFAASIESMQLVDYKVRVVNGEAGTAARNWSRARSIGCRSDRVTRSCR